MFARHEQRIFRKGWRTDLSHFFVSHMGVQISVLLTMVPAALLFHWMLGSSFQQAIGRSRSGYSSSKHSCWRTCSPTALIAVFHAVPLLWRFHAIHHSCEHLDWLASSRLHILDIVVTRAVAFLPLYAWASRQKRCIRI